jgi:hypothetical protein
MATMIAAGIAKEVDRIKRHRANSAPPNCAISKRNADSRMGILQIADVIYALLQDAISAKRREKSAQRFLVRKI